MPAKMTLWILIFASNMEISISQTGDGWCQSTTYTSVSYQEECGLWKTGLCTRYRSVGSTKYVCCDGYSGPDCDQYTTSAPIGFESSPVSSMITTDQAYEPSTSETTADVTESRHRVTQCRESNPVIVQKATDELFLWISITLAVLVAVIIIILILNCIIRRKKRASEKTKS